MAEASDDVNSQQPAVPDGSAAEEALPGIDPPQDRRTSHRGSISKSSISQVSSASSNHSMRRAQSLLSPQELSSLQALNESDDVDEPEEFQDNQQHLSWIVIPRHGTHPAAAPSPATTDPPTDSDAASRSQRKRSGMRVDTSKDAATGGAEWVNTSAYINLNRRLDILRNRKKERFYMPEPGVRRPPLTAPHRARHLQPAGSALLPHSQSEANQNAKTFLFGRAASETYAPVCANCEASAALRTASSTGQAAISASAGSIATATRNPSAEKAVARRAVSNTEEAGGEVNSQDAEASAVPSSSPHLRPNAILRKVSLVHGEFNPSRDEPWLHACRNNSNSYSSSLSKPQFPDSRSEEVRPDSPEKRSEEFNNLAQLDQLNPVFFAEARSDFYDGRKAPVDVSRVKEAAACAEELLQGRCGVASFVSQSRLWAFFITENRIWWNLHLLVLLLHMALAVLQKQADPASLWMHGVETIFFTIYLGDIALRVYWGHFILFGFGSGCARTLKMREGVLKATEVPVTADQFREVSGPFFKFRRNDLFANRLDAFIICWMFIEWLVSFGSAEQSSTRLSLVAMGLRLIFRTPKLLDTFRALLRALRLSLPLLVMLLVAHVVFATVGVRIFGQVAAKSARENVYRDHGGFFGKVDDAMFSLFVLTAGENYPEVMIPAYAESEWNSLYFIVFFVLVGVVLLATLLPLIVDYHRKHSELLRSRNTRRLAETVYRGMFLMLAQQHDAKTAEGEMVCSEGVSKPVFKKFWERLDIGKLQHAATADEIFGQVDSNKDGWLQATEFWELCGQYIRRPTLMERLGCAAFFRKSWADFMGGPHFLARGIRWIAALDQTVWFVPLVAIAGYTSFAITIGEACVTDWDTRGGLNLIELLLFSILMLHALVRTFFTAQENLKDPMFEKFTNTVLLLSLLARLVLFLRAPNQIPRADLATVSMVEAFPIAAAVLRITRRVFVFYYLTRAFLTIRLVTLWPKFALRLSNAVTDLVLLLLVLLISMYMFALGGMHLFADVRDHDSIPQYQSYDTFGHALLSSFQLFTAANWGSLAAIYMTGLDGSGTWWYFVLFHVWIQYSVGNLVAATIYEHFSDDSDSDRADLSDSDGINNSGATSPVSSHQGDGKRASKSSNKSDVFSCGAWIGEWVDKAWLQQSVISSFEACCAPWGTVSFTLRPQVAPHEADRVADNDGATISGMNLGSNMDHQSLNLIQGLPAQLEMEPVEPLTADQASPPAPGTGHRDVITSPVIVQPGPIDTAPALIQAPKLAPDLDDEKRLNGSPSTEMSTVTASPGGRRPRIAITTFKDVVAPKAKDNDFKDAQAATRRAQRVPSISNDGDDSLGALPVIPHGGTALNPLSTFGSGVGLGRQTSDASITTGTPNPGSTKPPTRNNTALGANATTPQERTMSGAWFNDLRTNPNNLRTTSTPHTGAAPEPRRRGPNLDRQHS